MCLKGSEFKISELGFRLWSNDVAALSGPDCQERLAKAGKGAFR